MVDDLMKKTLLKEDKICPHGEEKIYMLESLIEISEFSTTILFGHFFYFLSEWILVILNIKFNNYSLEEYEDRPLQTYKKFLKNNSYKTEVKIIMDYIEYEEDEIKEMIKTKLDKQIVFNVLTSEMKRFNRIFNSEIDCKKDIIIESSNLIKVRINTFEMATKKEIDKKERLL